MRELLREYVMFRAALLLMKLCRPTGPSANADHALIQALFSWMQARCAIAPRPKGAK